MNLQTLPRLGIIFQHVGKKRLLTDGAQFLPHGSVLYGKPHFPPALFRVLKHAGREGVHQLVGENEGFSAAVLQRLFHGGVNLGLAPQQKVLEFAQPGGGLHNHVIRIQAVPEAQLFQDLDGQGSGTGAYLQQGQPPAAAGAGLLPACGDGLCQNGGQRGSGGKIPAAPDVFNGGGIIPLLRVVQGQLHEGFQGKPAAGGRDVVGKAYHAGEKWVRIWTAPACAAAGLPPSCAGLPAAPRRGKGPGEPGTVFPAYSSSCTGRCCRSTAPWGRE